MNINNVLVLLPLDEAQKNKLKTKFDKINFIYKSSSDITSNLIQDIDVIIGNPPPHLLKDAHKLKWLQLNSAGTDSYIKDGVLSENVILTNATGAYGLAISEHMIAVLLTIFKKLNIYRDNQKNHIWRDEGMVRSIYSSKVLIIGLGNIGEEFAKRVKAFGAHTIGVRRSNLNKPDFIDELYLMDKIDELLPDADVVALSLPNTNETYKMFSKKKLDLMKKNSVLLNVGRGNVLDTEALCDAVKCGHLLGAGLDVTDPEPLPKNHRIWDIDNIIITPHISGGYHIKETLETILEISIHNLNNLLNDEKLMNIVDFSTGYAKK